MASMTDASRTAPRRGRWRWTLGVTALLSLVAAWPLATLVVGDPFAAARGPRLDLVPAALSPTGEPVFTVPAFRLVDHRGEAFGSDRLLGKVWVATFFFTSCPTLCPKLTARTAELQARLEAAGSAVDIVTFTVDPANDTPAVLGQHAATVGARARWIFLTGEAGDLERTIVKGFKQPMGAPDGSSDAATAMAIAHGVRFVLVDRALGVRGLYDTDDEGMAALLRDAALL